jgi:hypothetical protein
MARQPLVGHGLLIVEASRSHSDTQHTVVPPGRMIGPTQRPLPKNTQLSRQTSMPPAGFEPAIAASEG